MELNSNQKKPPKQKKDIDCIEKKSPLCLIFPSPVNDADALIFNDSDDDDDDFDSDDRVNDEVDEESLLFDNAIGLYPRRAAADVDSADSDSEDDLVPFAIEEEDSDNDDNNQSSKEKHTVFFTRHFFFSLVSFFLFFVSFAFARCRFWFVRT